MRFALWGRKRRDRELQEEMQAHLTLAEREEMEVEELLSGGSEG